MYDDRNMISVFFSLRLYPLQYTDVYLKHTSFFCMSLDIFLSLFMHHSHSALWVPHTKLASEAGGLVCAIDLWDGMWALSEAWEYGMACGALWYQWC
jgi:hypothetical protein